MKKHFLSIFFFIISINCTLAQQIDTAKTDSDICALQEWKAGRAISAEAIKDFGLCNCFSVSHISNRIWMQMQGKSYQPNPHIKRHDLRHIKVLHWDGENQIRLGEMICHASIAHELTDIFRQLYEAHYPIQRMLLPDHYNANDELQMTDNNSSGFCFRNVSGSKVLSKHAKGLAVDINPLYNPYVRRRTNGTYEVRPATARRYSNRNLSFPYKISRTDLAYKLFIQHGYQWGGAWRSCKDYQHFEKSNAHIRSAVTLGNEQPEKYLPLLKGKRVALYGNHSSIKHNEHILDFLVRHTTVTTIYSPEHGFRGTADAGASIADDIDSKTGIPILSLYGANHTKHLNAETINRFDILVIDIQDVGLRYYTYYITMCHLIDACARHGKQVIILDRPNPNGHYVDGPLLHASLKSGVGHLPIPVVHGLTLGELARMAIGEQWLNDGNHCKLTVIPCLHYTHQTRYSLPTAPSPNLPNMQSVYLYPSLCPFEGTILSLGRGTHKPFQQYGHPALKQQYNHTFIPQSLPGAKNPPLQNETCYGQDLTDLTFQQIASRKINLSYVIKAYQAMKEKGYGEQFFTPFFDKLMGQTYVREMIIEGKNEKEIRARWQKDVEQFKKQRKKYLLYPENN